MVLGVFGVRDDALVEYNRAVTPESNRDCEGQCHPMELHVVLHERIAKRNIVFTDVRRSVELVPWEVDHAKRSHLRGERGVLP